ncbi:unnamed protein product [Didymodactylos carnosus]|uniref:Uncharacterized protein n=1 Tax=Didymodactylos carnosus TaxID=1234261 RepID=A0A815WVW9_9BILA|nr:unnamed protein product [Didymodactylos carnosus]CAF4409248.1 unnamed protein product [Didymodactylos carnosus]
MDATDVRLNTYKTEINSLKHQQQLLQKDSEYSQSITDLYKSQTTATQTIIDQNKSLTELVEGLQTTITSYNTTLTSFTTLCAPIINNSVTTSPITSQMPTRSSQTHVVRKPKIQSSKNVVIGDSSTPDLIPKHLCTTQHQVQVKTSSGSNINRLHEQLHNGDFDQLLSSPPTATFIMGTINLSTESPLQTIEHTKSFISSFNKLHPNVKLFIPHVPYRSYSGLQRDIETTVNEYNQLLDQEAASGNFVTYDLNITDDSFLLKGDN